MRLSRNPRSILPAAVCWPALAFAATPAAALEAYVLSGRPEMVAGGDVLVKISGVSAELLEVSSPWWKSRGSHERVLRPFD